MTAKRTTPRVAAEARDRQGRALLHALTASDRARIAARDLAVIVAHPDDETIGCGAQLRRLVDVTVMVVTDGAPRAAGPRGELIESVDAHSKNRAFELQRALSLVNIPQHRIMLLGFSDQTAALRLVELTRTIYRLTAARDLRLVLTHAYEGGHPDHDATCFAVHLAAALRRRNGDTMSILEMPLYRAGDSTWLTQTFGGRDSGSERAVRLTPGERDLKARMFGAYASQNDVLARFATDAEYFRPAPAYDFTVLPNNGRLLYEQYEWGMTGSRWLALARAALEELGFGDAPCL